MVDLLTIQYIADKIYKGILIIFLYMVKRRFSKVRRTRKSKRFFRGRRRRSYEPEPRIAMQNLQINKKLKLPLPSRYFTELNINCIGQVYAASAANIGGGCYVLKVKGNSLHHPFADVNSFSSANFNFAGGVSSLTAVLLAPAGYSNFMQASQAGFYNKSIVLASKIRVTATPQTVGDMVTVALIPINPTQGQQPTAIISVASSPLSKGPIMCSGNNMLKDNTIWGYCSTALIEGVTRSAILADNTYFTTANADPTSLWDWYIVIQSNDSASLSSALNVDIQVKYYVCFENNSATGISDVEV